MKKSEVEVGAVYAVRVSERIVPVQIIRSSRYGGWQGRSLITGRDVRIRTAGRLRRRLEASEAKAMKEAAR